MIPNPSQADEAFSINKTNKKKQFQIRRQIKRENFSCLLMTKLLTTKYLCNFPNIEITASQL